MEKAKEKIEHKRRWRVATRKRKRHSVFVAEYVKTKFQCVYNEADNFFKALTELYPQKIDVKKTKEFKEWRKAVMNTDNPEPHIIIQTLSTDGENNTDINDNGNNEREVDNTEENNTDINDNGNNEREVDNTEENNTDINDNGNNEREVDNTEENHSNYSTQKKYTDNMLLEIPLERYIPPQPNQDEAVRPEPELPFNNDHDDLSITDERIREIVAELQNDPELQNYFNEYADQNDEGVEIPTIEEEVMLDFQPFDDRLEVEIENWESYL